MSITPLPTPVPQTSDPTNFDQRADAFLAALPTLAIELNAAIVDINSLLAAAGFSGTSTTSLAIGTGSKTLTTQTGRGFAPPAFLIVASAASPSTHKMFGVVTAYNTSTGVLTLDVTDTAGSGSRADWQIALSGPQGQTGNPFGTPTRIIANYNAAPGEDLECDTTGGSFIVTLPADPSSGDTVVVSDGGANGSAAGFGTNPLTVARNGSTINGLSQDATVSTTGAAVRFVFSNSTWRVRIG